MLPSRFMYSPLRYLRITCAGREPTVVATQSTLKMFLSRIGFISQSTLVISHKYETFAMYVISLMEQDNLD